MSLLVSNTTCSSAELFVEQMADSYNTLIIGSKTYGKKYIYNRQFINNVEILIPKHKLSLSFDINKHFDFNQYYKIKSKFKIKKEYNFPVIKSYNELKGGDYNETMEEA
ncbi:S41 family peptidase [Staphylococcus lutrae]|uniref:Uncharacterized protein n=2 Tax=Staphylococcus lutrae TaxID=155085 RepID=A0AAC9WJI4_9STAP|nr:S41 family peptidase [Staphylococcus lutrae]ARJ51360.1 hypothetical protein B5P37_08570 [Staphylococcus lutrae]